MRIVHTGPETYEQFVDLGLDVQRRHAGMSAFAHPHDAWNLWWRPAGCDAWREVKVGDSIDIYDIDLKGEELTG